MCVPLVPLNTPEHCGTMFLFVPLCTSQYWALFILVSKCSYSFFPLAYLPSRSPLAPFDRRSGIRGGCPPFRALAEPYSAVDDDK